MRNAAQLLPASSSDRRRRPLSGPAEPKKQDETPWRPLLAGPRIELGLPLSLYAVLISWQAYARRELINLDAIAYIRNAQYIAEGHLADSISAYWNPLLSWFMAPLLAVGMDGLYAARVVLAIWGALLIVAAYAFLHSIARCPTWLATSIMCMTAVAVVPGATGMISPDLLLFAALLAYCAAVVSPHLLRSTRLQLAAGALAGLAYLAKSYAFPFFMVHFAFSVAACWVAEGSSASLRTLVRAWLTGMLAFVVVAGPWVTILSLKHERLTFSTSARAAHTIIGPADEPRMHPLDRLYELPPGRQNIWETPEVLSYNTWSPLESSDYLKHQIAYSLANAKVIMAEVAWFDLFRFTIAAMVALPVLLAALGYRQQLRTAIWMLGTVGIYAGGFVPVYYESRYLHVLLWVMCCIYCGAFVTECLSRFAREFDQPRWLATAMGALIVISFAGSLVLREGVEMAAGAPVFEHRRIARQLRAAGLRGPVASLEPRYEDGAFIAYHLDQPYAGCLQELDGDALGALEQFQVQLLLVPGNGIDDQPSLTMSSWLHAMTIPGAQGQWYVFVPSGQKINGHRS